MTIRDDGLTSGSDPATGTDPTATTGSRRRGVRVTYAAAVALGLAVGSGAIAGAATGGSSSTTAPATPGIPGWHGAFGGTPPAAVGTVATVGSNTFTLTTHDGTTVTVDVTGSTTYVDPGVTSPTFANVKVGEHVAVFGTDASNTVAATKVAVGPLGGPGDGDGPGGHDGFGGTMPAAVGTVATVGTGTFTVTAPDGTTVTVDVGSSTTYMEVGKTSVSIADVTVGTHVAVWGTDANNTVTATKVGIGPVGAGPGGPGGMGDWAPPASGGTPTTGSSVGSTASFGRTGTTLN